MSTSRVGKMSLAVAAAASLVVGSAPASSSAAPLADVPEPLVELAGQNVVRGSTSAWTDVLLPKRVDPLASFDGEIDRSLPYVFEGDGRMVGFVLVSLKGGTPRPDGPSLVGWSLGHCARPAPRCAPGDFQTNWAIGFNLDEGHLPRGPYRLYLIADGAPATVRFEMDGLKGTSRIRPEQRADARLTTVPTEAAEIAGDTTFWGGHEIDNRRPGVAFTGLWADGGGAPVAGEAGVCTYEKEVPEDPSAFAPLCPRADASDRTRLQASYNEVAAVNVGSSLPAGLGTWYAAAGIERAGAVGLTLYF